MLKTPKALRLHIGLYGRTNTGKSSFLNMLANQDVAIISPVPGTTTDVVKKSMELLLIGPVMFLDTAGIDDTSELSDLRLKKTTKAYDSSDVFVLVMEADNWSEYEERIYQEAKTRNIPLIVVVNKIDLKKPDNSLIEKLKGKTRHILKCSSVDEANRNRYVNEFKEMLLEICPDEFLSPPLLIGDLLKPGDIAVLMVPIDLQAPKGRLILPQVQAIRDALDNDAATLVVKEREFIHILDKLKEKPELVVCDSQVVQKMVAYTPPEIKTTTFSILFARFKGDLLEEAKGAAYIKKLKNGDKILIAEACSHHALEDDIGRVKIPRWLRQYVGGDLQIDVSTGRDYPDNLEEYKLVIHCGACMLTRREMLFRLHKAKEKGVPVTNYGVSIAFVQGVLERVLEPFPAALEAYKKVIEEL
ncbi:MAG: [FeFe] hydrogenase H-cluster maturation GTPase HydF [Candidatus Coatesbacteria bacterium]|nr:[FeFe] hydrogenase H-cluster maturation GTPase HydF [Candidatus Coatesbacteria bacterium]